MGCGVGRGVGCGVGQGVGRGVGAGVAIGVGACGQFKPKLSLFTILLYTPEQHPYFVSSHKTSRISLQLSPDAFDIARVSLGDGQHPNDVDRHETQLLPCTSSFLRNGKPESSEQHPYAVLKHGGGTNGTGVGPVLGAPVTALGGTL